MGRGACGRGGERGDVVERWAEVPGCVEGGQRKMLEGFGLWQEGWPKTWI